MRTELIQSPIEPGTVTKIGLGTLCLWHDLDHYEQLIEYFTNERNRYAGEPTIAETG